MAARMKAARRVVEGLTAREADDRSGLSSPCTVDVATHVQGHPAMRVSARTCIRPREKTT